VRQNRSGQRARESMAERPFCSSGVLDLSGFVVLISVDGPQISVPDLSDWSFGSEEGNADLH
jgi:hypothetical protein